MMMMIVNTTHISLICFASRAKVFLVVIIVRAQQTSEYRTTLHKALAPVPPTHTHHETAQIVKGFDGGAVVIVIAQRIYLVHNSSGSSANN